MKDLSASYSGDEEVVRILLEKGVDVNDKGGLFGNGLVRGSGIGEISWC